MSGSIRLPLALLATAVLAALAGCQGGPRPIDNDPLVGGSATSRPQTGGVARRDDTARGNGDVPPIPPAATTSSPAALTVGAIAPVGDRRTPAEGVTLHGPRAKAGSAPTIPAREESTSKSARPSAGGFDSYESLQQQLQSRGVVWQQLRMVQQDRWDFFCAIPDPKQPNVRRNYEARSRPSSIEAIREVIAEIDGDHR